MATVTCKTCNEEITANDSVFIFVNEDILVVNIGQSITCPNCNTTFNETEVFGLSVSGTGAIAVGKGAVAAGKGGIAIGGDFVVGGKKVKGKVIDGDKVYGKHIKGDKLS